MKAVEQNEELQQIVVVMYFCLFIHVNFIRLKI